MYERGDLEVAARHDERLCGFNRHSAEVAEHPVELHAGMNRSPPNALQQMFERMMMDYLDGWSGVLMLDSVNERCVDVREKEASDRLAALFQGALGADEEPGTGAVEEVECRGVNLGLRCVAGSKLMQCFVKTRCVADRPG